MRNMPSEFDHYRALISLSLSPSLQVSPDIYYIGFGILRINF
jgi:hypothetical protein